MVCQRLAAKFARTSRGLTRGGVAVKHGPPGRDPGRAAVRTAQLTEIAPDWDCPWPLDWQRHYCVLADLVDADGQLPDVAPGVLFEGDGLGKWVQRQKNPGTWTRLSTEQQERLSKLGVHSPTRRRPPPWRRRVHPSMTTALAKSPTLSASLPTTQTSRSHSCTARTRPRLRPAPAPAICTRSAAKRPAAQNGGSTESTHCCERWTAVRASTPPAMPLIGSIQDLYRICEHAPHLRPHVNTVIAQPRLSATANSSTSSPTLTPMSEPPPEAHSPLLQPVDRTSMTAGHAKNRAVDKELYASELRK